MSTRSISSGYASRPMSEYGEQERQELNQAAVQNQNSNLTAHNLTLHQIHHGVPLRRGPRTNDGVTDNESNGPPNSNIYGSLGSIRRPSIASTDNESVGGKRRTRRHKSSRRRRRTRSSRRRRTKSRRHR